MKKKKAVSPMVSTVLLIMIVIILAIIILLWTRGFIKEAITKEINGNKKRVNEYCGLISLTAIVNQDNTFGFENNGNVPINGFNLKLVKTGSGSSEVIEYGQSDGGAVNPGMLINAIEDIDAIETDGDGYLQYSNYESIKVIPVLLGETNSGRQTFTCPENTALEI